MRTRKTVGQLIKENHWSVQGLKASLHIKKEHIRKWEKLNRQYKKYAQVNRLREIPRFS